jgi:hypothetical protein
MHTELLTGIYLNFSFFTAICLWLKIIVPKKFPNLELIIYTCLASITIIIIIFLLLSTLIPDGITFRNIIIISQILFIMSGLVTIYQNKNFRITNFSLKNYFKDKVLLMLIVILFINVLVGIYTIYVNPPVEPDTLSYHLQNPVNWYQNKSITFFPSNEQRTMLISDNSNFLSLWFFVTFQNDYFVEIPSYLLLIFGSISIYYLLSLIEVDPKLNMVLSLLFYYGGNYLNYFASNLTGDVNLAALTFSSLALFYSYFKNKNGFSLLFFSISNGLLLGTKPHGVILIFLEYLLLLIINIKILKEGLKKETIIPYLYSLIICFLIGGFYYFRNIYFFSNPFFPKAINILNILSFPGAHLAAYEKFGFNVDIFPPVVELLNNIGKGLLGNQMVIFYLPTLIFLFTIRKRLTKIQLSLLFFPIFYSVLVIVFFGISPARYFFPLILSGILTIKYMFLNIHNLVFKKNVYNFMVFFLVFISVKQLITSDTLSYISGNKSLLSPRSMKYYDGDHYYFSNNLPNNVRIGYLLPENAFLYPFYGSKWENILIYVNTTKYQKLCDIFKKNKIDYFLSKRREGDMSNSFLITDLINKQIVNVPEDDVFKVTNELKTAGIISFLGSGTRIDFYKVNRESL